MGRKGSRKNSFFLLAVALINPVPKTWEHSNLYTFNININFVARNEFFKNYSRCSFQRSGAEAVIRKQKNTRWQNVSDMLVKI